ncbi:MAG: hypothetical protein GC179_08665 [Anaerolineaceae bacterium]|nr:hypothetical protein [Anaerolineaceae bacterium]
MAQNRKERMDDLAQKLAAEYVQGGEEPYEFYSTELFLKQSGELTGEYAVVAVYTVKKIVRAEKQAGLTPRMQVKKCPTCGKPM